MNVEATMAQRLSLTSKGQRLCLFFAILILAFALATSAARGQLITPSGATAGTNSSLPSQFQVTGNNTAQFTLFGTGQLTWFPSPFGGNPLPTSFDYSDSPAVYVIVTFLNTSGSGTTWQTLDFSGAINFKSNDFEHLDFTMNHGQTSGTMSASAEVAVGGTSPTLSSISHGVPSVNQSIVGTAEGSPSVTLLGTPITGWYPSGTDEFGNVYWSAKVPVPTVSLEVQGSINLNSPGPDSVYAQAELIFAGITGTFSIP